MNTEHVRTRCFSLWLFCILHFSCRTHFCSIFYLLISIYIIHIHLHVSVFCVWKNVSYSYRSSFIRNFENKHARRTRPLAATASQKLKLKFKTRDKQQQPAAEAAMVAAATTTAANVACLLCLVVACRFRCTHTHAHTHRQTQAGRLAFACSDMFVGNICCAAAAAAACVHFAT